MAPVHAATAFCDRVAGFLGEMLDDEEEAPEDEAGPDSIWGRDSSLDRPFLDPDDCCCRLNSISSCARASWKKRLLVGEDMIEGPPLRSGSDQLERSTKTLPTGV